MKTFWGALDSRNLTRIKCQAALRNLRLTSMKAEFQPSRLTPHILLQSLEITASLMIAHEIGAEKECQRMGTPTLWVKTFGLHSSLENLWIERAIYPSIRSISLPSHQFRASILRFHLPHKFDRHSWAILTIAKPLTFQYTQRRIQLLLSASISTSFFLPTKAS